MIQLMENNNSVLCVCKTSVSLAQAGRDGGDGQGAAGRHDAHTGDQQQQNLHL